MSVLNFNFKITYYNCNKNNKKNKSSNKNDTLMIFFDKKNILKKK